MERSGIERCCSSRVDDISSSQSDKFINYMSPPSLEDIALVSVAVNLWRDSDKVRVDCDLPKEEYRMKEEKVFKKIDRIFLSDSLKMEISNIIRLIGFQLCRRRIFYTFTQIQLRDIYENRYRGDLSCWASSGAFNASEYIKNLIKDVKSLSLEEKYLSSLFELACIYCLEECISDLWPNIPDKDYDLNSLTGKCPFIFYWTAVMQGKSPVGHIMYDPNRSIYANMIGISINLRVYAPVIYFWQKLSFVEKDSSYIIDLLNWVAKDMKYYGPYSFYEFNNKLKVFFNESNYISGRNNNDIDSMFFLLSQIDERSQKNFFQANSYVVLKCLLHHWPLRRFFLPTARVVLKFLPENLYVKLMIEIAYEIDRRRTTQFLLREVWCLSPLTLKKSFLLYLTEDAKPIVNLLSVNDIITIGMILSIASAAERKVIVSDVLKFDEIFKLIYSNILTVPMLNSFSLKALTLDTDRRLFRESLAKRYVWSLIDIFSTETRKNFESTFGLLNWAFPSKTELNNFKQNFINPIKMKKLLVNSGDYAASKIFLTWYFESKLVKISELQKHSVFNHPARFLLRSHST